MAKRGFSIKMFLFMAHKGYFWELSAGTFSEICAKRILNSNLLPNDMNEPEKEIAMAILKKLHRGSCWGKGHMLIRNVQSIAPAHMRSYAKEMLKKLVKQRLVVVYGRTKYGLAVHLNIAKKREIEEILFGTEANQNA
jgi:thiamine kinase-like enzyme